MEFLKRHWLIIVTVICWVLAIALIDIVSGFATFLGLIGIILIIVLVVKHKKEKSAPRVPLEELLGENSKELPFSLNIHGKEYTLAYSYTDVNIVGRQYYPDTDVKLNESVYLVPEPENEYDNEAVAVKVKRAGADVTVGYLAKDSNIKSMVNDFANRFEPVFAFVDSERFETISVGFYK